MLCGNFLCEPGGRPIDSTGSSSWWSYVYITVNHYSPFLFPGADEQRPECAIIPPRCFLTSWRFCESVGRRRIPAAAVFPVEKNPKKNNCYILPPPPHTVIMYFLSNARSPARTCLKIRSVALLRGMQSRGARLESSSAASDVTSACSAPPPSPAPFLLPILFHQLSPSFDTSEGAPHTPVTPHAPPPPPR